MQFVITQPYAANHLVASSDRVEGLARFEERLEQTAYAWWKKFSLIIITITIIIIIIIIMIIPGSQSVRKGGWKGWEISGSEERNWNTGSCHGTLGVVCRSRLNTWFEKSWTTIRMGWLQKTALLAATAMIL